MLMFVKCFRILIKENICHSKIIVININDFNENNCDNMENEIPKN